MNCKLQDLSAQNPQGRVDVLLANVIDRFSQSIPELRSIVEQHREVIHGTLQEQFEPKVVAKKLGVDVRDVVKQAEPFFPLLGSLLQECARSVANASQSAEGGKA